MRRKLAAALIAVTLSSVMIIQPAAAQESENVEAGEDAAAQAGDETESTAAGNETQFEHRNEAVIRCICLC